MRKASDYIERTGVMRVAAPGLGVNQHVRIVSVRQDYDRLRLLVADAASGSNLQWVNADDVLLDKNDGKSE
jgi:hypothetical protein